ncbi:MAG: AI-2E family transporter [Bacteroidales bacterium]
MNNNKIIAILLFIAFLAFIGWFFSDIVLYMFIALILSLLGNPVVKLLTRIRFKKWSLPQSVAAGITLLLILGVITSFIYLLIPLVTKEIQYLMSIDPMVVAEGIQDWLLKIEEPLRRHGILMRNEHLIDILLLRIKNMVSQINFTYIFGDAVSFVSTLFIATFSVLFMTFFSLKDNKIFFKMIKKVIPISYRSNFDNILGATQKQLVKYFTGVFLEMLIMGVMEGLICYFLGVPNAILIGFIGGLLNIIPYVGPLIATGLGVAISLTAIMPTAPENMMITWMVVKVVSAFAISKMIDDFVLQPVIYGKSVQAHPLEIFVIILVAAHIGGVLGMVCAVPAYSLIRIIVKEFFGQYYFQGTDHENQDITKDSMQHNA